MNLAVTSVDRLKNSGITVPPSGQQSGYLALSSSVTPSDLALLKVIVHTQGSTLTSREIGQLAEREMLKLLHKLTSTGLRPNTETVVEINAEGQRVYPQAA